MQRRVVAVIAAFIFATLSHAVNAATLDDVRSRGYVQCGVSTDLVGFSQSDEDGNWTGLDADYCRAVAAAIFGNLESVKFVPLTKSDRFSALQTGAVDILAQDSAWTMTRDTSLGIAFVGVNYYGGQAFMTRKSIGVASVLELSGASVCVRAGSTTELNVVDYYSKNNMNYELVLPNTDSEVSAAYDSGLCQVYSADAAALHSARLRLADPEDHVVLPEIISKEPLGPAVRQGDERWFNIVKWVHFALLNAEELDITQAAVDEMGASENVDIRRLLGTEGAFGEGIGLSNDWAANMIRAVGNYGEIFERNLGANSELNIVRGLNALWIDGGIQYAPPIK